MLNEDVRADKALCEAVLSATGVMNTDKGDWIDDYLQHHEYGLAVTSAMIYAVDNQIPMEHRLVEQAVERFKGDMGESYDSGWPQAFMTEIPELIAV